MSHKQEAISGGKWMSASTAISTILQFGQVAVLARLLEPSVFGIVSVSTLMIAFFNIFANLGFSNSIIYKQEEDRQVLSTIYLLNLILGLVIGVVVFFSWPLVVGYYKEPRLEQVIKLSSLYFIIVYVGQLYLFLLQKELRFKAVASIDITGTVAGTLVTVVLAFNGFAELSLIYGQLAQQTAKSILQMVYGAGLFSPTLTFDLSLIKDHLRFGLYNVGDGIVGFIQANSDNILVGGMLGVKQLGYYTLASQLAVFPIARLSPIVLQVAYPILARLKGDTGELKKSYLTILDLLSYVNLPLLAGLFITADSVVPLFYGPGWEPTILLIRIFVFVSIFTFLINPLFTLAFSKGKPKLLFYLNLITLFIKVPLVYLFAQQWGVVGIASAFLVATAANLLINFRIVRSLIGPFFGEFARNISKPILFCLAMVGAIFLYKSFADSISVLNTGVQIAIGALIYCGLTIRYKYPITELKALRKAV
ncbi:MOP flippase family protein [Spirosoma utsteinense]|uniref:PST family polysaccharide transporter/lipopolysaccharide exporter n=1 Tax=Spirosoma utsteinense TaxID=2585773 RepID=A0ABR6WCC6_9BACT|nr:MOP flippase family protein [Spirosoma utsteinense]MBC3788220.1 PST family polysaccharide transporter/lipopolysaccharide exporter [Spirosoma utsteinense]MBC3794181.1 PST family polysaccharide transporter/lipopolysaccharide exporter [Spirosoma utsteinense]